MTPHEELLAHEKLCAERYDTIHHRLDRIENMLNKLIWALVAGFIALLVTTISSEIKAAEKVDELIMETDVGEVVLTDKPCNLDVHPRYFSFNLAAYATEFEHDTHFGCWAMVDNTVYIHFPELGDVMATYKAQLFHPRPTL